jgi:hypothetical protein
MSDRGFLGSIEVGYFGGIRIGAIHGDLFWPPCDIVQPVFPDHGLGVLAHAAIAGEGGPHLDTEFLCVDITFNPPFFLQLQQLTHHNGPVYFSCYVGIAGVDMAFHHTMVADDELGIAGDGADYFPLYADVTFGGDFPPPALCHGQWYSIRCRVP